MITRLILGTVLVPILALLAVWALPVQADEVPAPPMTTPCMKSMTYGFGMPGFSKMFGPYEMIDESCHAGPPRRESLKRPAADPQPVDERPQLEYIGGMIGITITPMNAE